MRVGRNLLNGLTSVVAVFAAGLVLLPSCADDGKDKRDSSPISAPGQLDAGDAGEGHASGGSPPSPDRAYERRGPGEPSPTMSPPARLLDKAARRLLQSLAYSSNGLPQGSGSGQTERLPDGDTREVSRLIEPGVGEELWIIARGHPAKRSVEDAPPSGALLARLPGATKDVPVPLKHTDVKGRVSGYIATVEVTQQFHNPYDSKIEAKYVFPLPQNAAVNEFVMTIGDRRIRGIIREREEAERIYREARAQGHVASLLTQERPNIFTQSVANIEPGKRIDINIKYFNTLAYADGWYEFVFPMVVGPRFNPPGSTGGVGAVARGKQGASGQKTAVQYLKPGERSGHDIALAVTIDAGVPIEEIDCRSHVVEKKALDADSVEIRLTRRDAIPNKDFVLRYKVAGDKVKSALVAHRTERGGFFTMMLYPPASLVQTNRTPMEMVFVLDCSGSMSGRPIAQAKTAIKRALRNLGPDDTFQIIRFSNNASRLGRSPVAASEANVGRGLAYVDSLNSGGGTMMIEGIKAALDFPHDPRRFRFVTFCTDGYIGNEKQILGEMHKRLGASRVFSFGVGSSVNRYLMERMAGLGRGAVAYLGPDESAGEVMDRFFQRVSHPALTDIEIDWGDAQVSDVYPKRIPDLFVGRPVVVTGRFKGDGPQKILVKSRLAGRPHHLLVQADPDDARAAHPGIPSVWARLKIKDLANLAIFEPDPGIPGRIKDVALEYSLVSAYTAFVAVDSLAPTKGEFGTTVAVPVPVPDGVRYETAVQR